ncbi:hypothetical protein [Bradyrhizobium sp. URHC0002]
MSERQLTDIVKSLLPFLREAQPTAFAEEGPRRHKMRSKLCLQGWPWDYADQQAAAILHTALNRIGAHRPRWIEGQQEYCHDGYLRDDHCWGCGSPLPQYKKKYCCGQCAAAVRREHVRTMYDNFIF